jgi:DegV family protein with EDD domain
VAVTLSSELSATYQAALLAAEAVKGTIDVRVVDSRLVTAAEGLLCLEAATLAATGASVADVASHTASRVADAGLVGTIDTMDHLVKSGRLSGAKAVFGSMLSVKPILTLRDGLVVEGGRQRTRARSLEHLATRAEAAAPFDWFAVGGGDADDLGVVVDRLRGIDTTHPMFVTEIGPVVGTHAGPGIVGVCWLTRTPS